MEKEVEKEEEGEQNDMQGKGPTHRSVTWGGSRSTLTLRWQGTHTHIIHSTIITL